jgi:hypothetical protein
VFFIDRNGVFFRPILDFLRRGTFSLDDATLGIYDVMEEARFYNIDLPLAALKRKVPGYATVTIMIDKLSEKPWKSSTFFVMVSPSCRPAVLSVWHLWGPHLKSQTNPPPPNAIAEAATTFDRSGLIQLERAGAADILELLGLAGLDQTVSVKISGDRNLITVYTLRTN